MTENMRYEELRELEDSFSLREEQIVLGSDETIVSGKNLESTEKSYSNYESIDWIRDTIRDQRRREEINSTTGKNKSIRLLLKMWHGGQAWIHLAFTAALIGILAAFISISTDWLADTRFGYCEDSFWISRRTCCKEFIDIEGCTKWITWSQIFSSNGGAGYFSDFSMYVIFSVLFATMAAVFVKTFSPWAAGSGIAEIKTILGGFVIHDFNSPRTLLVKCIGLVFSVSSGLNVGKEGPLIHVASCAADLFARLFPKYNRNQAKRRELISASVAAGVSVAFGAPIGGVLFSLEEASYYFPHKTLWRTFFTSTLAAVILKLLNPFGTGQIVIFQVKYSHGWTNTFELLPFFIISALGSFLGTLFIRFNIRWSKFRKSWKNRRPIEEILIISIITAILSYFNPYTRGNSGDIISMLFNECDPNEPSQLCNDPAGKTILLLFLATGLRLILTVFTFGTKVPSGIFIPPIVIGASLGRAVGVIVQSLQHAHPEWGFFSECTSSTECINPGIYAVVGAAATLGGVTRMTVSLAVIMFELTGDLSYIIPLMMAVMITKWVGDASGIDGMYDELIRLNEYPFLDNKREYIFHKNARDIMTSIEEGLVILEQNGNTVTSLTEFLKNSKFSGFPIVNNKQENIVVGYISRQELTQGLENAIQKNVGLYSPCVFNLEGISYLHKQHEESKKQNNFGGRRTMGSTFVDLRPWTDDAPFCFQPHSSLTVIFNAFKKLGLRYTLITERGALKGIITKKDILFEMKEIREQKKQKKTHSSSNSFSHIE